MSGIVLGINQAILAVNKINISEPLAVYYQLEECFGCRPERLVPLKNVSDIDGKPLDQFVIDTKRSFHLELRHLEPASETVKNWCRFNDIALNSYGQYRIDVHPGKLVESGPASGTRQSLECVLNTIDPGECLLCPIAILICILFVVAGGEHVYKKFWNPGTRKTGRHWRAGEKLGPSGAEQPGADGPEADVTTDDLSNPPESLEAHGSNHPDEHRLEGDPAVENPSALEADVENQPTRLPSRRIECLDIFRGLTIAGMIFVNYGGAGYAMLDHKAWDGITMADFVFPFFVFSMGASVAITTKSMVRSQKPFVASVSRIVRRSLVLAMLGLFLNSKWINYNQADGLSFLRWTGVLQRFAVSYLVVALLYFVELLLTRCIRAQSLSTFFGSIFELLIAVNYTSAYVYITFYHDYDSGCPAGYIGPGGLTEGGKYANCTGGAAAWLDRLCLGPNHMYNDREVKSIFKTQVSHDPEGILGYLTSVLLTLIGLQAGKVLLNSRTHKQTVTSLSQWSVAMAVTSLLIFVIPINKRLWSITFVSVTAMAAFVVVIFLYTLVDIYSYKQSIMVQLLSSAGKNSIFLYVGHSLISGMLPWWFPLGPQATHLQLLLRLSWATLVWLLIAHYMALKKIFIRV